jgi:hypothetical protein
MEPQARHTRRLVVSACAAIAVAVLSSAGRSIVTAASPQDGDAEYARVVDTLRKELAKPFSSPDDPGLAERRARLRTLFSGVPPAYAKTLFDRLGPKPTGDDLSKEFHYRLASATRKELLGILAAKIAAAPSSTSSAPATPAKPDPVFVWSTDPLPATESPRFDKALAHLEDLVNKSTDDRKWRYQCWFNKLKTADVDDRVIEWSKVCPAKTGAIGAAYIVGPCDITQGTPVSQDEIYKNIRSVSDVDTKGADIGIVTFLKSDFVVSEEMTSLPLENLRATHDRVVMAIDKLGKWADNPMGGSSAMPKEYVSIKDWIGRQQRNPKSVYSCQ